MARPVWKGNITFGLVNVPVVLHPAERRADLHFHLLDSRDRSGIRYERVNEQTGEEVPWNAIVKAYKYDGDSFVVLNEKDFERAAPEATQNIEIEDFVDQNAIDYVYFERPYYLVPGAKGDKAYALLRESLARTKKVGIAKVVIHTRQHLAAVMVQRNALVLNLLRFHQELVDAAQFDFPKGTLKSYKITDDELQMAEKLIANMSSEWQPRKFHDEYHDALMAYIEKKAKTGKVPEPAAPEKAEPATTEVINIMNLLKESVEKLGRAHSGAPAESDNPATRAARSARRRPPAKPRQSA
jgi:DNA end-binding protein Ku